MNDTDERTPTNAATAEDPVERSKALKPGTVVRHQSGSETILSHRKADDTGWWNTDGSGLADAFVGWREWVVTDENAIEQVVVMRLAVALALALGHTFASTGPNLMPGPNTVSIARQVVGYLAADGLVLGSSQAPPS